MAINDIEQYTSGFLPYILLFTQALIILVSYGSMVLLSTFISTIILLTMYCTTTVIIVMGYDWWLCMMINISIQYNGGLLPDIILLTQGYYHYWGTRLNTM